MYSIFKKYDKDNDGCLNQSELADLFSICPIKMPWGKDVHNTVEADIKSNAITYCGFLSQWVYVIKNISLKFNIKINLLIRSLRLTTYFDAKTSMELLSYLGYNFYEDNLSSAFNGIKYLTNQ